MMKISLFLEAAMSLATWEMVIYTHQRVKGTRQWPASWPDEERGWTRERLTLPCNLHTP